MFASKLAHLREESGLSQQYVADGLSMARATYANLEAGRRSPTLDEIKAIAELFEIDPAALIDTKAFPATESATQRTIQLEPTTQDIQPREVVKEKIEALREVLLYVLDKVGAKPNVGETVLYKLLYFIDFDYYEKTGQSITGLRYIRNHFGPTPTRTFDSVVAAMKNNGDLETVETKYFNHLQKKYLPVKKPRLVHVTAAELQHIDEELARLSDKTAQELSSLSHRDVPWMATKDKQPIDYQLAMYRTTETSVKAPEDEL